MIAANHWLREQWRTYVRNATSVRDYRVQMRGSRSVMLFGLYLTVLILIALAQYGSVAGAGQTISVSDAQSRLRGFYSTVMILLAVMIVTVTPALSATALVVERQRRSLDLVFSAPVTAKYYLVGKMLSAYRFIWMLLVLSLPVTATCVVLGGASYEDVLVAYVLLSLSGLVLTALSLAVSVNMVNTVGAIFAAYSAAVIHLVATSVLGTLSSPGAVGGFFGAGGSNEASVWLAMNPFLAVAAAPTHTMLWDIQTPNWILAAVVSVLACHLSMLAAGAALNSIGTPQVRNLRIYGLLYAFGLALLVIVTLSGASPIFSAAGVASTQILTNAFQVTCAPVAAVIPYLCLWSWEGWAGDRPDGLFRLRRMLSGRPSGGLPYLWAVLAAITLAVVVGSRSNGISLDTLFWMCVAHQFALWTMLFSVGRLIALTRQPVRTMQLLVFVAIATFLVLPSVILVSIDPTVSNNLLWALNPWQPMLNLGNTTVQATVVPLTAIYAGIAAILLLVSERKRSRIAVPSYLEADLR